MRYLKIMILCLLLLAVPLEGFAAARMLFCAGHGGAPYAGEAQGQGGQDGAHDASGGGEQAQRDVAARTSDDSGCGDGHSSACAICCTAAGMAPSNGPMGGIAGAAGSRPAYGLDRLKGRIPPTPDHPPIGPRPTRVA